MRVHVNVAASLDGRIALPGGKPLTLSGPEDLARVHRLRAAADAILVGVGTVLADDPSLLAKAEHLGRWPDRQPIRVVLDSRGRSPPTARVFDGRARTLLLTATTGVERPNAETAVVGEGRVDLRLALRELAARGVRDLLVEGGGGVIAGFLAAGLVDDLTIYTAPVVLGPDAPALVAGTVGGAPLRGLRLVSVDALGEGALARWTAIR